MMEGIKADLEGLGIKMDLFSSEHALVSDGKVDEAISALTDQGLVYRGVLEPPKGQLLMIGSRVSNCCSKPPSLVMT